MKKSLIFILLISSLVSVQTRTSFLDRSSYDMKTIGAIVFSIAIISYIAYKWIRTPNINKPTLAQLNPLTIIPNALLPHHDVQDLDNAGVKKLMQQNNINTKIKVKEKNIVLTYKSGISSDLKKQDVIYLYSGGYLSNSPLSSFEQRGYWPYIAIKKGLFNGACIAFNLITDFRASFNFCQDLDIHCVELIYEEIRKTNIRAKIVFVGVCKGSTLFLRFLEKHAHEAEYLKNIKVVIAESPPVSLDEALGYWPCAGRVSRFFLPNCKQNVPTILNARQFPVDIPILLGSMPDDTVCTPKQIASITRHLNHLGSKLVHVYTTRGKKISHGQQGKDPGWRDHVRKLIDVYVHNEQRFEKDIELSKKEAHQLLAYDFKK